MQTVILYQYQRVNLDN